jgi:hypothetical protein
MMLNRVQALALAATCLFAACSEQPTSPRVANQPNASRGRGSGGAAAERAALLTDLPVAGTLVGGGTFAGTMTVTKMAVDRATGALTVTAVLNGTATKAAGAIVNVVDQTVTAPATLSKPAAASSIIQPVAMASCGILDLVLGPLHLDLLGLVVDLNQVVLDITGATGAGNLLGNLLCALTSILDIPGALAAILQILDTINNILSGLTVPGIGGVLWVTPPSSLQMWSA